MEKRGILATEATLRLIGLTEPRLEFPEPKRDLPPNVTVHRTVTLGEGVVFDPGANIRVYPNAEIGAGARIGAGSVIGYGARIGAGSVIGAGVHVRDLARVEGGAVIDGSA